jgi:glycosyltransferase involved in cell wall biosynthesis
MIAYTLYEVDARVQRAAEALVESGHHVDLFAVANGGNANGGNRASGSNELLRIYRLRMRMQRAAAARYLFEYGVFFAWALGLVSFFHARRRYDVVYVHNIPNFMVFAGLLPKISGAKIILDVHEPAAELLASIRGRDLPRWVRRLAGAEERVSISFSDAVITVSEPMRQLLSRRSKRPVAVVMNLPESTFFVPPEASRDREDLDWLVYSGSIAHRNGLDLVVRALWMLASEFPRLRLRVIGDGPALEAVVGLAKDLGVAERAEFLGFVPYDQVPSLVSDAAAGISTQREDIFGSLVFSMKVAEYAALGLPVICSGISTMRHYFSDDELLFFEPGSAEDLARAIRDLLTHPTAAEQRVVRSRIKLDKLDWPAQKETLVATAESLAASGRLPSRREARPVRPPDPAKGGIRGQKDKEIRRYV